ncbi:hypothetical protein JC2156_04230 [Weissella koreensis KCTC 3621]|uniref:DUF2577 family protein n=1 Tax=Weissella koreensis TaxID=165096 RepID=UPI00026F3644|nr:DUF2577 family protein [Weissella koreensis]EJF33713.1 hypothetical protein JC2156_05270 [Weissella koreensis KCTC 3621]EJF34115.1 hypothetical protein JC2156_04230 [Weissella koreensis KCTC 3621]
MTQKNNAGNYLLSKLNSKGGKETDYTDEVFGQVISTSPLKILVDSRMTLTAEFLEVSMLAKPLSVNVKIPIKDEDNKFAEGTVKIWNGMTSGDKVRMLRVSSGQRFVIMEVV